MIWSWRNWLKGDWLEDRRATTRSDGKRRRKPHRALARPQLERLETRELLDSGGAAFVQAGGHLTYGAAKGPLVDSPSIHPIFIQDKSTGQQTPAATRAQFDGFFQEYVTDGFLPALLTQYDINGFTIGNGSFAASNDDIGAKYTPDTTASFGPSYPSYSDAFIQNIVLQEIAAGRTASQNANNIYIVFTPPGDAAGDNFSGNSVDDFFGYHGNIPDAKSPTGYDYYAVIPDEIQSNFNVNFDSAGVGRFESMTETAAHEIAEATTDPVPPDGWTDLTNTGDGGEIADHAEDGVYMQGGYSVQYLWSNALRGDAHAPLTGTADLVIDQITPPAVTGFIGGPVATFTDTNTSLTASNFSATVMDTGTGLNWTNVSITGSAGHFVVNATPPVLPLTAGMVGTLFNQDGFYVTVSTSPINTTTPSGAPIAIRNGPYRVAASSVLNYIADSGSGTNNFVLKKNGANFQLSDNGLVVFMQPVAQTTTININADPTVAGDAGANVDDSLTLDYSGGLFTNAVTFNGGPGLGAHNLTITGATFTNETYSPTGPHAGTISLDGQTITYSNVTVATMLAPASNFLAIQGTASTELINVVDGPLINGTTATTQVNSNSSTFAPVDIANNHNVSVSGLGGADTISLNDPNPEAALATLVLFGSTVAGGACNILSNASTVTTVIAGTTTAPLAVNVGNAGSLQGVQGVLNLQNGSGPYNNVTLDDSADTSPRTIVVTTDSVQGFAATINCVFSDTQSLTINGGSGGNTFNVQVVGTGVATTLNGGSGNDVFNVVPQAIGTNLTINGQAPTTAPGDTLIYNGAGTVASTGVGSGTITQAGQGTITFTGIEGTGVGADPALSTVSVAPPGMALGAMATVTLIARDGAGNQETTGGLTVVFSLGGGGTGNGTFSAVTDHGNGTYTATFTATALGSNTITATIGGQPLTSTPAAISVVGPASPAQSTVSVAPVSIQAGGTATITLQAKDANGTNELTGGLTVTFALGTGTGSGTLSAVTDNHNGTYTATLTGTSAGTNTISATINTQPVTTAAPTFTVTPGVFSLSHSLVSVLPASIQAGSNAAVTLQAEDAFGNNETSGGLTVVFGLGTGTAGGTFSAVKDNHNGTYTATFTGITAGANTVTATINTQPVTATAPTITVTPGPFSLATSTVSLLPTSVQAGSTTSVTLVAKDSYGNQEASGGLAVVFALGTGSGSGTLSAVTDHHNGIYTATLTGTTLGTNTVTATIGGQAVTSTPPTLTVIPGPVDLLHSVVSLLPNLLVAGTTGTVTLLAEDAFGNQETGGGLAVAFGVGAGTGSGTFSTITDHLDGSYTATFTGITAGTNTLIATIGGQALTSPLPTFTVTPAAPSVDQSTVSVSSSSLQAGSSITVTLQAEDAYGNDETSGGLTVAFGLGTGAGSGFFGPVTDNHNGTYTASFTGSTAGTKTLTATINGQPVTSTPPTVTVTPGPASLFNSTVSVTFATILAGDLTTVTLQTTDAFGNNETSGGLAVAFGVGPGTGNGTFGAVTDNHDGTYTAFFTGTTVGTNTLTATIATQPLTSTPATFTVAPDLGPSLSTLAASPASLPIFGTSTITLQAIDANGDNETSGGHTVVFVLIPGTATGTLGSVSDNGNGTYSATFTGTAIGTASIIAAIDGQAAVATPLTVRVTPGAFSLAQSTVSVSSANIQAGGMTLLTLQARDAFGNNEDSGGLGVTFYAAGGKGGGAFNSVTDNQDGTYTATFTGVTVGALTIGATIDGQPITAAAPTVTVTPGPVSTVASVVSAALASVPVAGTDAITLQVKDAEGNLETSGGLAVAFSLGTGTAGGSFSAVIDNHNGTYTATFTANTVGSSTINATINGQPVTSILPNLTVTPAAVSLARSTLSVAPSSIPTGTTTTVTLQAEDAFGNNETSGGLTVVFSLGNGTALGALSGVIDNQNGTYTATFLGTSVGSNSITATINGQTVTSTPPTITVTLPLLTLYPGVPTVQIPPVASSPLQTPVQSIAIVFSQPVKGFSLSNLTLTRAGVVIPLTTATLTTVDNITWMLGNLESLTSPSHLVANFTLTLSPAGIVNPAGTPLANGTSASFIGVDPALMLQGSTLIVPGTGGNDFFTFTAGSAEQVTRNGVPFAIDPTVVGAVQIQGNGGIDTATLTAAGTANTAVLGFGGGLLQGMGYTASASGVTFLIINGGSTDTATFSDASGSNTFVGTPGYSYLNNGSQLSKAVGFHSVTATSTSAGQDTALLSDTAGSSTFVGTPASSTLTTSGPASVAITVVGYKSVQATAATGTTDTANLSDVSGSNLFVATPAFGYLLTSGTFNEVIGFKTVIATAATKASDAAYFYDAPGNNTFVGAPGSSSLSSGGVLDKAVGFKQAIAIAPAGGHDSATLHGAATGSNTFIGAPTYSYYISAGAFTEAVGFVSVIGQAVGGLNSATLYDAPGGINTFVGTPTYAYLKGSSYYNEVIGFGGGVTAQGSAGSSDTAYLYGLAAGGDTFVGTAISSYLSGSGFLNQVIGFGAVEGLSQGPNDVAYLYAAAGGGTFVGQGKVASLISGGAGISLDSFARVIAIGSSGPNHLILAAHTYLFSDLGSWM